MSYEEKPADGSNDVYFGIEWSESNESGGTFTITPKIYRWDRYNTNNSGGRWSEDITKTSGSGTDSWSGLSFGSGSGYRTIDTFSKRTYSKSHSAKTIYYHLYTDSSFGTYNNGFITLGAQTWTFLMTVPARTSYNVTLNANGGSGGTTSLTKWYGETLSLTSGVTAPTRTGHTFAGWYDNSSGTGSAVTSYTGNSAKTYYAKWTANTYIMTYKANGGSGSDQTQTKTYGVDATVKAANTFSRTGYTFHSWNTKSDGTGTTYSAGGKYTSNAQVTLYAIWTINTWAVSYNGNGSTGGSTAAQTKTYNQALTLRSNGFTKTNYNFVKWNTAANGSGTDYNAGVSYESNAALTLYAQWTLAHANPSIGSFTVKRCDSNGDENSEGTYMLVSVSWTCDSSATGTGSAKVVANGVTDTVSFTGASGSISGRVHQNSSGTKTVFPISSSFTVTLTVTDSAGYSTSKVSILSVAFFTMHFKNGGKGVGIGATATDDGYLNIGLWTRLFSKQYSNYNNYAALTVKSQNRNADAIRFIGSDSDGNGDAVVIGNGGMTVIGSGESAISWYNRVVGTADITYSELNPGTETTFVTSDNDVVLINNANTVANRIPWIFTLSQNGPLLYTDCGAASSVNVGTSSNNGVTANTNLGEWYIRDKNKYWTGCLVNRTDASGGIVTILGARNQNTDGTNVANYITLTQNKDGSRSYSVTDAAAFRTAIGVGTIGTKSSLAASDIPALAASKITSGTFDLARLQNVAWTYLTGSASASFYVRWCKVAHIVHVEVYGSKSLSSNTNTQLATTAITSGNRPSKEVDSHLYCAQNNVGVLWVTTGGLVYGKDTGAAASSIYGFLSYPAGVS